MLAQPNRLRQRADFDLIRKRGTKLVDPLVLLIYVESDQPFPPRFAISAGKRVGNAVVRNRTKRLLREAVKVFLPDIKPGSLCLFVVRNRMRDAALTEVTSSVENLFARARLIQL